MLIFDQEPAAYTPAYNQSPWVVRESDSSGSDSEWRMQVEVFDGNTPVSTLAATFILRFRANSGRRVVFDPSKVLQSLLSYDHSPMTTTYAPWGLCENSIQWYSITWKSQKYISGAWVTQNQFTKERKCVWNAAQTMLSFISYNQNNYVSFQNDPPIPLVTYQPTIRDIGSAESMFVHFISGDEQAPVSLTLTKYPLPDLQGTPLAADPVQANPFGLSFTGLPSIDGNEYTRHRVRAGVGTRDFANMLSPPSFVGVQSYKVDFLSTGSATPLTFSFNINDCSKYASTRLHWLNDLGGFEAYTFKLKSQTEDRVMRENFVKQHNELTSAGVYGYGFQSAGRVVYHTRVEEYRTISTDNLTDDEMEWLRGLISSPAVFIEAGNVFVPVIVDTKKWMQKRGVQDGVFQLEVDIRGVLDNYTQSQ